MSFTPQDIDFIRKQTLRAISSNREPGMHFAGYFLNYARQRYETSGVEFTIEPGPHCTDENGIVNRAALLYMADMALAGANRVFTDPNSRTATLMLRVEFTGEPARGRLRGQRHWQWIFTAYRAAGKCGAGAGDQRAAAK